LLCGLTILYGINEKTIGPIIIYHNKIEPLPPNIDPKRIGDNPISNQ